jgi:hypothetical protein
MSATRALLGELIDDAGLFPPAQLSMADALAAHERAQAGDAYWMQGRFVVPASRLAELRAHLDDSPDPFPTSVVLDGDVSEALATAARETQRDERIVIEAFEVRAAQIAAGAFATFDDACTAAGLRSTIVKYIECLPDGDTMLTLAQLREALDDGRPVCAKVRCGGVTADAVPDARRLAAFIAAAKSLEVPFKATAGLHHPIRQDSATAGVAMHGFLNVIGGAVLLFTGVLHDAALEAMLRDDRPEHFRLDEEAFAWNGVAADASAIGAARAGFVHSYGSCSFDEPVDDLCALGMLAADTP